MNEETICACCCETVSDQTAEARSTDITSGPGFQSKILNALET